jgi:hypothetical protein
VVDLYSLLLVAIMFAFFLAFLALFKTLWHPLSLTSLLWLFSSLGVLVGPIQYLPLTSKVVIIVSINFLALLAGSLIPYLFKKEKKTNMVFTIKHFLRTNFFIVFFLSLLGALSIPLMLYDLSKAGFLKLLFNPKSHLYLRGLSLPGSGFLANLPVSALLLSLDLVALLYAGIYYTLAPKPKKYIFLFPLTNIILVCIIQLGRAPLIWGLMLFFCGIIFSIIFLKKEKIGLNFKLVAALAVIALLLISLQIWRGGSLKSVTSNAETFYGNKLKWKMDVPGFYSLITIYSYFCSPIPALSEFLKTDKSQMNMGVYTFTPFFKYILGRKVDPYYQGVPPLDFNVFSYIREIYSDYGLGGVIIFNILLGLFASLFFMKCRRKFSFYNFAILAFLTTFLLYSLWRPLSSATLFWASLTISFFIGVLIKNKFRYEQCSS